MSKLSTKATIETTVEVRTEFHVTYTLAEDATIVWQYLFVGEECIQRTIVGWYSGDPDEHATEQFSHLGVMAQYLWD